ncbi:hypothetical protein L1049_023831 [Liquidambar formosana]|uniref:RING-type domain-containing protein n=1 Tax=Liquidambar formosana TaxID=63359 RepID=A0AAP0RTR3_LIQFO
MAELNLSKASFRSPLEQSLENSSLTSEANLEAFVEKKCEVPSFDMVDQMGAVEKAFEEVPSSGFETHCAKRLSRRSVDEKIPKIRITGKDVLDDASGDRISCSICLQEFQLGEMGRSLPQCHHMFHLCCIDKWLLVHGSCPLCRRDLNLTHSADNGNRSG